ncbi:MAG TPA: pyruvate:ferredoxin (flavodoxin) oxidoreductase [Elusimicrobiales bacterium]|nr:pyruvate:ferredoxin (flavodoxin) oxidoreductase [Elusimicrobiales bacterium]HPO96077.1 pyruvate:ferredoxin (flavodoxin) oxidoreductase [Elusimicrobiales bacterium]
MSKSKNMQAMDGNTATAYVAHATNEVIAIYPITPSSVMGELSDLKSAKGEKNIWGLVPNVIEMQSEGGASGAVHGSLTSGALTTTFTASQGLLLMIPNMYKIAGELTSTVFHVSARAVATHALSIFGDHSDVMATRQTGWSLLASANPQEAMDFALIAQKATLRGRVPVLHFFDGFRTSHELNMVDVISFEDMRKFLDENLIAEHRKRGLNPERPAMRGTAQNPDVFFQGREAVNKFYNDMPKIFEETFKEFEKLTGRKYNLFDYVGDPNAENVIVIMASGADVVEETVKYLNKKGEKVGVIKVRVYRPFSVEHFLNTLPKTVKKIAVMDRTKEPGATGEPLYLDVVDAVTKGYMEGKIKNMPLIIGGRYGLGSKEFNPAMAKAVYDNLNSKEPKNNFTVGIKDDVTNLSLDWDDNFNVESKDTFKALFFGLGSDGTIGANKNTIKIISEETENYAQGYFVYDSKKAGSLTVSHVRFGKEYIRAPYLINRANFVGCHQFSFLEKYEMAEKLENGGVFLLNSPYNSKEVWDKIPAHVQKLIIDKKAKFYVINASEIAKKVGMGSRINVIMQTAFFAISGVLPKDEAINAIKESIKKTYIRKGMDVVEKNWKAVDETVSAIEEVKYPEKVTSSIPFSPCRLTDDMPDFVKNVTCEMISYHGDNIPVSKFPVDGTYPTATTQYEKRNIALEVPVWEPELCIQCGICSLVCPHAVIRLKAYEESDLKNAPSTFKSAEGKGDLKGLKFTVQVSVEDCTGCGACVYNCPAKERKDGKETGKKAINMHPQIPLRETERKNWEFFLKIQDKGSEKTNRFTIKGSQLVRPLFEFSGACAGCGETPYVKLLSQLYGDHLTIANATGCSSIYGGNLPTTPYCVRNDGKGPVWSNSLFEDNAEFGLGMRLAYDSLYEYAINLLKELKTEINKPIVDEIINSKQDNWVEIEKQRGRVNELKNILSSKNSDKAKALLNAADYLIKKSVWIVGGDGWAYDIGYGGLDHVMASGKNIKAIVLDTEVYSNTGGQMSKSTPLGAIAQFAAGGKPLPKKDLGMMMMTYGNVYVAQIAMGANMQQTLTALKEAEEYDGPAIVIAYSHCIAHGIPMNEGMNEQKKAVASGRWILYRFNPKLRKEGKNPLIIDSPTKPTYSLRDYLMGEIRFKSLFQSKPEIAEKLAKLAEEEYRWRLSVYEQIAKMNCDVGEKVEAVK